MKIVVSLDELKQAFRDRHYLANSVEIEVDIPTPGAPAVEPTLSYDFFKLVREIESLNYTSHQKIQAIKKLREYTGYSLLDAKLAIENWATWKDKGRSMSGIPKMCSINNTLRFID